MKTILELQTSTEAMPRPLQAIGDTPARQPETGVHVESHRTLRRILVPVDFTPASVHALHRAASLAERFGSTVCLLHVIETHPFAMNGPAEMLMKDEEEVTRDSTEQLSRLGREELGPHVSARPLVRRGKKAAREILQAAETLDCDLIILASHKRTALGRVLFGSTADEVMHHAACAVLVIPCTDEPQPEPTLWRDDDDIAERKPLVPTA